MYRLLLAIAGIFFSVLTSAGTGEDVYQLNGVWSFKTDPYCKGESENGMQRSLLRVGMLCLCLETGS